MPSEERFSMGKELRPMNEFPDTYFILFPFIISSCTLDKPIKLYGCISENKLKLKSKYNRLDIELKRDCLFECFGISPALSK